VTKAGSLPAFVIPLRAWRQAAGGDSFQRIFGPDSRFSLS
jgi:hypothetical protein